MATVEWRDVTFQYPDANQPALKQVHVFVRTGEFVTIAGPTGSGKTTLLRLLKREVAPGGRMSGVILVQGRNFENATAKAAASSIGLVMQHPDQQLVVDTVEHELAFGMENLGMPHSLMRRRMAEIAGFFGLEALLDRRTDELSGGQKMMVNLAAVLMLQPSVLLLDEPLAQLDPLAARDLLGMIKRLNEEWGVTVIMSEHRIDDLLPLADRLVRLDNGIVTFDGTPRDFANEAWQCRDRDWLGSLPAVTRWAISLGQEHRRSQSDLFPPLSVKEARMWLAEQELDPAVIKASSIKENIQIETLQPISPPSTHDARPLLRVGDEIKVDSPSPHDKHRPLGVDDKGQVTKVDLPSSRDVRKPLLRANGLFFSYDKQSTAVIRGLSWSIHSGERVALFGGNGSGKSTLLQLLAGLRQAQRGEVRLDGEKLSRIPSSARYARIGYLAQNPLLHYAHDTLREDLEHAVHSIRSSDHAKGNQDRHASVAVTSQEEAAATTQRIAERMGLEKLLDRHPHDLSGGERQLGALALLLLGQPQLLLLDEPTKGIDVAAKERLIRLLGEIHQAGTAIVVATHDVEFAAQFADRCALLFQGEIMVDDAPELFFKGNLFYATPLQRLLYEGGQLERK